MRVRPRFFITVAVFVVLIAVIVFISSGAGRPDKAQPVAKRGNAPVGYDSYASVVDTGFAAEFASRLSEIGDDPATGFRTAGSPAEHEAASLVEQTMKDIGLSNVTMDKAAVSGWVFGGATLTYVDASGKSRQAILGTYQTTVDISHKNLQLVWAGKGAEADYKGLDVKDKIVLIEVDSKDGLGIDYPAMQAKIKGAAAVIAVDIMEKNNIDRIGNSGNVGIADIPTLSISQKDADSIKYAIDASAKGRQIEVTLNAFNKISDNATTYNVWGEIPGRTDQVIYFISHYDGYYHAYYDDACGAGMMMSIAKAFIESGVKPEKTIRFVCHGAKEWGMSGTPANWAEGAYLQVSSIRPDWAKYAFTLINIDGGFPVKNAKSFDVSSTYELGGFVSNMIASFGDRSDITIAASGDRQSPAVEDFVYSEAGVPTISNVGGEGDREFYAGMEHSNMDTLEQGGFSDDAAKAICDFYGFVGLTLDKMPLKPMNFSARLDALENSLADETVTGVRNDPHMMANLDRAKSSAALLDKYIQDENNAYLSAVQSGDTATQTEIEGIAQDVNDRLFLVSRDLQGQLISVDSRLNAQFANEELQNNIISLTSAIKSLENGKPEQAVSDGLVNIGLSSYAMVFDKKTCDYFQSALIPSLAGTWAAGRTVDMPCNVDDIIRSLLTKMGQGAASAQDFEKEISALADIRADQRNLLTDLCAERCTELSVITDDINALLDVYAAM